MTATTEPVKKPLAAKQQFNASILIPRDKIEINEKWNVRQEYDSPLQSIEDLAADIKMRGQTTPVIVTAQPTNSRYPYRLIAGFRRLRAMASINLDFVRAEVFEGDEEAAAFVNVAENVARNNLQGWELAIKLVELREKFKLSGDKMGKLVGCSKGFANNLMRCEDHLIPILLKMFHSPKSPSLEKMIHLAALKTDEQEAQYEEYLGIKEKKEGEGGGNGAPAVGRPTATKIALAIEALLEKVKDEKLSKDDAKLAMSCLRWAAGLQATIPGVYDPRAPTEPKTPAEPKKPTAPKEAQ